MTEVITKNLVQEITTILQNHNHPNPSFWETQVHPDAISHSLESVRRFQINQYWRDQLGRIDLNGKGNTIGDRFCLIEDGSVEDWLRLFDQKVARAIVKYKIGF